MFAIKLCVFVYFPLQYYRISTIYFITWLFITFKLICILQRLSLFNHWRKNVFIFFLFRDFKFFDFPFVIYKFIKWFCWILNYLELKQWNEWNECGDLYFMGILTYYLFCIIDILIRGFVFNIKINLNPKVLKQFP